MNENDDNFAILYKGTRAREDVYRDDDDDDDDYSNNSNSRKGDEQNRVAKIC